MRHGRLERRRNNRVKKVDNRSIDQEFDRFARECKPYPDGRGYYDPTQLRDAAGRAWASYHRYLLHPAEHPCTESEIQRWQRKCREHAMGDSKIGGGG